MAKAVLVIDDMPKSCSMCKFSYEFQGVKKCELMNVLNNGASRLSQNTFSMKRHEKCPLRELQEYKPTIGTIEEENRLLMNAGWNACLEQILNSR